MDEAALFAGDLFRMYVTNTPSGSGWKVEVLSVERGDGGGVQGDSLPK